MPWPHRRPRRLSSSDSDSGTWNHPHRDTHFQVSGWDRDARPVRIEERRPQQRRRSSIERWRLPHHRRRRGSSLSRAPVAVEEVWPAGARGRRRGRRGSSLSDVFVEPSGRFRRRSEDYHRAHPPIVLPPLYAGHRHTPRPKPKPKPTSKPNKKKKKLYFTHSHSHSHSRPRHGFLSRLADALTGQGSDVFVTFTTPTRPLHHARPPRWQWTNHGLSSNEILDKIFHGWDGQGGGAGCEWADLEPVREPFFWARRGGGSRGKGGREGYDFLTGRYSPVREWDWGGEGDEEGGGIWNDAVWRPGGARRGSWPEGVRVRDKGFRWWERVG